MPEEQNNTPPSNEAASSKEPNRILVAEEAVSLLSSDNITVAMNIYKSDTPEKEIALEFVNSHYQFMQELVINDLNRKLGRSDFEIKDLVSHVNVMMKNKDEYIFTTMVIHSPVHYHLIQEGILKQKAKEEHNDEK
ncbi:MAG: hypothetical protein ACOCX9_00345 [Spirochaetota bacterium]